MTDRFISCLLQTDFFVTVELRERSAAPFASTGSGFH